MYGVPRVSEFGHAASAAFRRVLRIAGCSVTIAACSIATAAAEIDREAIEFFEKSVRPVLVQHCYECHSAAEPNGGLALDSREGVAKGGDSGPALVAGDPDKSRLIEAVRYQNADLQMPPQNRLSKSQVAALERWVALGAPDPREQETLDASPAPTGMTIADGRKFWAFREVEDAAIPSVRDSDWVRTPIDAFILAKLEANGLRPAAPADKRTLLRRVTFDLIGLPPTPTEMEAFLRDDSPDAFRDVVERLLSSPDYGVRWGRHWLDVARYADSNGLDENLAFGNAWRYRDYVVAAFNDDKPFNQFLIEQVAGDLLPDADQTTKTATGFLALGAKVLAEPDRVKLEMDTIDEQLDTIGKAFLGMTIGCARCHDHKFDPLKQSDYYSLAAIFKSTQTLDLKKAVAIKPWYEHEFVDEAEREKMKAIDKAIAEKKKAATSFKTAAYAKLRTEARDRAADYLATTAGFEPSMPMPQIAAIAEPVGLHPRVLHHCRSYLEEHREDAFWAKWHECRESGDIFALSKHYRDQFEAAEEAWAAAKKADPKVAKLDDAGLESVRAVLYDTGGFLAVPAEPENAFDAATFAEYHRLAEAARAFESEAPDLPGAMGVSDGEVVDSLPIHIRGNHRNHGKSVRRDFPVVMRSTSSETKLPDEQSGRLDLARWMADARHPLTARVYVNRVWRWHFGAGLVASTENFGQLGDRPTHPELLDWLARYLIESGWSTKALHRLIVLSSAYQMASRHPKDADAVRLDPENRWLWKFRLQRLEAEEIRDSVLTVAGRLDRSLGGKTIPLRNRQFVFDHTSIDRTKYDSLRRAMYLPIVRNNLYPMFEQFDFPDPTMPTGSRNATVVAPQALWILNSDLAIESAEIWAKHLLAGAGSDKARVRRAYDSAFGRLPTAGEMRRAMAFVGSSDATLKGKKAKAAREQDWTLFCQSLLASNEFIYLR